MQEPAPIVVASVFPALCRHLAVHASVVASQDRAQQAREAKESSLDPPSPESPAPPSPPPGVRLFPGEAATPSSPCGHLDAWHAQVHLDWRV